MHTHSHTTHPLTHTRTHTHTHTQTLSLTLSLTHTGDKIVGVATKSMADYDDIMHMISCMARYVLYVTL